MPQVASTGLHGEHERQSKMLLRNLVDSNMLRIEGLSGDGLL